MLFISLLILLLTKYDYFINLVFWQILYRFLPIDTLFNSLYSM